MNELIGASASDLQVQGLDIRDATSQIKDQLGKLEEECMTDFMMLNKDALQLYHDIENSEKILSKVG